jgi:transcriptional regulator with XRE-family HTH domain
VEDLRPKPMIQESELGKRIKEYRMKKGLTLQKLEGKTGFTKGYLSKVENTKKAPPVSTLIVLAKALEISLSEIFGEKEENLGAGAKKIQIYPDFLKIRLITITRGFF